MLILKKAGIALAVVLVGVLVSVPVLADSNGPDNGNRISNILRADMEILEQTDWVLLTWSQDGVEFSDDELNLTLTLGDHQDLWVRAQNDLGDPIDRVLVVVRGVTPGEFKLEGYVLPTILRTDDEYGEEHPDYPGIYQSTIRVDMPPGTTLGEIQSVSWEYNLHEGYIPHLDLKLEGGLTLTIEGAYANDDDVHGFPVGEWTSTFDGGTGGYPAWADWLEGEATDLGVINDSMLAWRSQSGGAAGDAVDEPEGKNLKTLGTYRQGWNGVSDATIVEAIEIEVDNWVVFTEAWVRNIQINGDTVGWIPLGWSEDLEAFYWGPLAGFTMTDDWDETTPVRITPLAAGTYDNIQVYVIQVPEE